MPLYKHTRIRRYRIGRFEFNNHLLSVKPEDNQDFIRLIKQLPAVKSNQIVEVNEEAYRNLEKPALGRDTLVVRGGARADTDPRVMEERARAAALAQSEKDAEKPAEPQSASDAKPVASEGFAGLMQKPKAAEPEAASQAEQK